jgi:hypothetical protein
MARMMRRVPLPLRTWSGALLVCALMLCLAGLARPAMAMAMPGPMEAASSMSMGAASGQMPVEAAGHAEQAMATDSAGHGAPCPMTQQHCAAPKATVAQDGPAGPVLADLPRAVACSPAALVSQPNAPPPALPPPELHRLCVSRT